MSLLPPARRLLALTLASAFSPTVAVAQPAPPAERATALKALADCQAVADGGIRLACFDAAAAQLASAEQAGDVLVLDRVEVRTAKRDAFGLRLPSLGLFDRAAVEKLEEVESVSSTVAGALRDGLGAWLVTLENGQVWRQTDSMRLRRIRRGDEATVRRGALGGYFLKIGSQAAVRADRQR